MKTSSGLLLVLAFTACSTSEQNQVVPDGFVLHPDFNMSLVASEPLISDPVQLEFDSKGNAYVLEMPGYPFGDKPSSIHQLVDSNADGIYDKKTLFADSLRTASSFLVYGDAILVAASPDLLQLRDTDGDGLADEKKRLITGFIDGNQQHNVNGLIYTLDHRIYLANGYNGGKVHWVDAPENLLDMTGHDLIIDLKNHQLELLGRTSGGHEIALDNYGNIFHTHNTRYLQHLVFPKHYLQNNGVEPTHALDNIGQYEDNGLGRIYPVGEQESRVNHPEQAGYFSGSCGVFHYGGHTFPTEFAGNIFVADVVLNLIHRNELVSNGASFQGRRVREEIEFLASSDRSFRPVTLNTGPDGALYVLDMNRQVIEHPEWIPDPIEKDLNLKDGMDRGRIYRIIPRHTAAGPFTNFDALGSNPIVHLGHTNQWVRMMAQQQILLGKEDRKTVDNLKDLLKTGELNDYTRLHTLWVLSALNQLDEQILGNEMTSASTEGLLQNILKITEKFVSNHPSQGQALLPGIINLISNKADRTAMQAVLTIAALDHLLTDSHRQLLVEQVATNFARAEVDKYFGMAIQCLDPEIQYQVISHLNQSNQLISSKLGGNILKLILEGSTLEQCRKLLIELGESGQGTMDVLDALADWLPETQMDKRGMVEEYLDLIRLGDDLNLIAEEAGLRKSLGIPQRPEHLDLLSKASQKVLDRRETPAKRSAYLKLLQLNERVTKKLVEDLLQPATPVDLQLLTLDVLADKRPDYTASLLVGSWSSLGPESRRKAGDLLLFYPEFQPRLLDAFEAGDITLGEMNMHLERRRELLFSPDESIRDRAHLLFDDSGIKTREESVNSMLPALQLNGVFEDGLPVFERLCAQCHVKGIYGIDVGPDLGASLHKSKLALLHDILDPNSACETGYLAHEIDTRDGKHFVGIIAEEEPDQIILVQQGGHVRAIARSEIVKFEVSGKSLMPEGLETGMSHQELADLLAFLQET